MSDIDKRLDSVLDNFSITDKFNKEHIELFKQTIKQLMADEFEKMIGKDEGYDYVKEENSGYILQVHKGRKLTEIEINKNQFRQELRQKLEEWKK